MILGPTHERARERLIAFRRAQPRPPRLERRTVTVRGLAFAVFQSPDVAGATPLLCVNGGLMYGHKILWPALAPLATYRRLIFYDQRGRGESTPPPDPRATRIEHDAGDVGALREALGIDRWDVLGHSWGGGIAMLGAERDRAGTRKLVLVDAVGVTSRWIAGLHEAALARMNASHRTLLQRLDPFALHSDDPGIHSAYSRAMYPAWFAEPELASMFSPPRSESRTGAAVAAGLRRKGYDWTKLVRFLAMPVLVIHGESDLLPATEARELVALLPGSRLELIPEAGHMPFWESPERFFSLVETFLSQPMPAST